MAESIEIRCPEDNPGGVLLQTCASLLESNEMVDCTISCLDGQVQAHRIVLASASNYLHNLLRSTPMPTPCSHPVLFLRNSTVENVRLAVQYIYTGLIHVSPDRLLPLLDICDELDCPSLRKAVNNAQTKIQNATTLSSTNSNHSTDDDEFEDAESPPMISIVKQESITENEQIDSISEIKTTSGNNLHCKRPSPFQSKMLMKLPKLTPAAISTSNNSGVKIHHDRSESFVYTNEDFGGMEGAGDEDEDSADADDVGDIDMANTSDLMQSFGGGGPYGPKIEELLEGKMNEEGGATKCPLCKQVFTKCHCPLLQNIKTHVNNYRPFKCDYCHNSFARSAHLKRHLRTHTGEKPYVCSICQRAFARQDKLKGHLERHVHHAAKSNTSSSMISYPPPSSHNAGQVPIKVLLPNASSSNGSSSRSNGSSGMSNFTQKLLNLNSSQRFGNVNGLSISLAGEGSSSTTRNNSAGGITVRPAHLPGITFTPMANIGDNSKTKRDNFPKSTVTSTNMNVRII